MPLTATLEASAVTLPLDVVLTLLMVSTGSASLAERCRRIYLCDDVRGGWSASLMVSASFSALFLI